MLRCQSRTALWRVDALNEALNAILWFQSKMFIVSINNNPLNSEDSLSQEAVV